MEDFMEGDDDDGGDDECESVDLSGLFKNFNISDYDFDYDFDYGLFGSGSLDSLFGVNSSIGPPNGTTPGVSDQTTNDFVDQTTSGYPESTTTEFYYDLSAFEKLMGLDGDIDTSYKDASDWIWKIVPPIVIILGSIGNLLTILIIFRQLRRSSTAVFLVALAISDIMIIYCGPIREWHKQLTDVDIRHLSQPGCKVSVYITYASLQLSSWLLVVVTMQRAIVVRWPHKTYLRCSPKGALVVIGVLIVVIYGLNAHFIYGLGNSTLPIYIGFGKCHPLYASYDNFHNNIWPWIDFAIVFALPFTILLTGNCIIIHQVNKQKVLRRRMSIGCERAGTLYEKDTRMVTVMLILLSVVFFVCMVPSTIYFILIPFNNKKLDKLLCKNDLAGYSKQRDIMTFWHAVVGCLSHLNATLNFVLYVISGSRFRKDIIATLCCKHSQHNIFRKFRSRRRSQFSTSTIRTLASSTSPYTGEEQKKGRTSSVDLNGIAKRLSKIKRSKTSTTNLKSNRHSEDTITSVVDTELETFPNEDITDTKRCVDISALNIDDAVSISSSDDDIDDKDVDELSNNFNGKLHTTNNTITQLCLAVTNVSKADSTSQKSQQNGNLDRKFPKADDRDNKPHQNDRNMKVLQETRIHIDPVTGAVEGLLNSKDFTIAQLCINASKLGTVQENRNAESFPQREESDSVTDIEDDDDFTAAVNEIDEHGLDVDPLSNDINDVFITRGVNDGYGVDPIDDYVIAVGYENKGFCTEYDLGIV